MLSNVHLPNVTCSSSLGLPRPLACFRNNVFRCDLSIPERYCHSFILLDVSGDPPVLLGMATFPGCHRLPLMPFRCIAFRQKIRKDALEQYSVADEEVFRNNLKLGREIADFLRKNIVQAEHLPGKTGEDNMETYSTCTLFTCSTLSSRHAEIRMTKHTELGDNATIKNPENMVEMPRRRRQKEKEVIAVE
jgi:hypothetical protein